MIYSSLLGITLILLGFSVFPFPVSALVLTSSDDIQINARVIGCGDGVIQDVLGEQCDGANLGGESCGSIGFGSGTLSCRPSCIFETALCTDSSGGGGSSGRSTRRSVYINTAIPTTNLVFSGAGNPGDTVTILNNGIYIGGGLIDPQGLFSITISNVEPDFSVFSFYTTSELGVRSDNLFFTMDVQPDVTTQISNIFFTYVYADQLSFDDPIPEISEDKKVVDIVPENPLFDVLLVNPVIYTPSSVRYVYVCMAGVVLWGITYGMLYLRRRRLEIIHNRNHE
jgi:hypothetical protein